VVPQISGSYLVQQASVFTTYLFLINPSTRKLSLRQPVKGQHSLLHLLYSVSILLCRYPVAEPASRRFWLAASVFHLDVKSIMQE